MKRNLWHLTVVVVLFSLGVLTAGARPIEFSEISLLVRAHESNPDIMQAVRTRKLLRPLTSQQEDLLKSQGASDDFIRGLRDSRAALSPAEANALAAEQQEAISHRPPARERRDKNDSLGENVRVFDVSYGHPINLSQWGGPDYEIAFQCRRYAGEDIVEPILTDNLRTYVDTATYLGQGRPDDSTTVFDRRSYVSVMAHESSRPISIDTSNPVSIKGVPYTLYPVYRGRGITLYYIGKCAGSVRLAVIAKS